MTTLKRNRKQWTVRDDATLLRSLKNEMSYQAIAAELDRSSSAVAQRAHHLRKRGVAVPRINKIVDAATGSVQKTPSVQKAIPTLLGFLLGALSTAVVASSFI